MQAIITSKGAYRNEREGSLLSEKLLDDKAVQRWNKLPGEVVDFPSLSSRGLTGT